MTPDVQMQIVYAPTQSPVRICSMYECVIGGTWHRTLSRFYIK